MGRIVTGAALEIQMDLGTEAEIVARQVGRACDIPGQAKGHLARSRKLPRSTAATGSASKT